MAVLNCKLCGAPIEVVSGNTVVECEYCGYKQEVPAELQIAAKIQNKENVDAVAEGNGIENNAENLDGYEALKQRDFAKAMFIFGSEIAADETLVSAHIGRLLADLKCTCEEDLGKLEGVFDDNKFFFELLKYADEATVERISNYNLLILENIRIEREKIQAENDLIAERREREAMEQYNKRKAEEKKKKVGKLALKCIFALLVIGVIVWFLVISPLLKYNDAVKLVESGEYLEGYFAFSDMIDYSDSKQKADEALALLRNSSFENATVGSSVFMGTKSQGIYPNTKAKEPIEWIVLDKQGNRVLLISKYVLERIEYGELWSTYKWSECTPREVLNSDFYEKNFTDEEKAAIVNTVVDGSDNKIFILSIEEVKKYMPTAEKRKAPCSPYLIENSQAIKLNEDNYWWATTTLDEDAEPAYIDHLFSIDANGEIIAKAGASGYTGSSLYNQHCFRPVMWVDISLFK